MISFFTDYGLFAAKTVTIVIAIASVLILISILAHRKKSMRDESIEINKLNQKFDDIAAVLNQSILNKSELKSIKKVQKDQAKLDKKADHKRKRIYVLDFNGDVRASAVASLREEITAILTIANSDDEVFVKLESGGGMVHAYGLAASQLLRIRDRDIALTIAVDKVAASGGYMMACVGDTIIAAPFAVIGSIGVIAQVPNFNKVLKKLDIDYNEFTAGEFKRTVTVFGENSDKAKAKFTEQLEDTHILFKEFIHQNRPKVNIDSVSTGEYWFGTRALEKNLVDELKTSDDYLLEHSTTADIYEIKFEKKKTFMEKISRQSQKMVDQLRYQ